jgi:hypothetical protein
MQAAAMAHMRPAGTGQQQQAAAAAAVLAQSQAQQAAVLQHIKAQAAAAAAEGKPGGVMPAQAVAALAAMAQHQELLKRLQGNVRCIARPRFVGLELPALALQGWAQWQPPIAWQAGRQAEGLLL